MPRRQTPTKPPTVIPAIVPVERPFLFDGCSGSGSGSPGDVYSVEVSLVESLVSCSGATCHASSVSIRMELRMDRRTEIILIPQASIPSFVDGVRVTGCSVGVSNPISVITPVQTTPFVAVAWHPYSLSLHMKEKTLSVTLPLLASRFRT